MKLNSISYQQLSNIFLYNIIILIIGNANYYPNLKSVIIY